MTEKPIPSLFCTNCLAYYPPEAPVCPICGSTREKRRHIKPPLTPDWQINLPGKPSGMTRLKGSLVLAGWNRYSDEVTIGLPEGGLVCLDTDSQESIWKYSLDRPAIGSPVVFGDWILQLTGRRAPDPARMLVFNRDFEFIWAYDFPNPVTPKILTHNPEWICCAVSDGNLIGINPATRKSGTIATWESTPRLNPPQCLVIHNGNTFYLATGTRPGQVLRIQGKNVTSLFSASDYVYLTDLLISDGSLVYICDEKGRLFAVDNTGKPVWTYEGMNTRRSASRLGGLACFGDHLFFGSGDHQMHCINRQSGNILWETPLHGTVMVRPLIWNDALLICGDSHGYTYGLDTKTGEIIWQYNEPSSMHWSIGGNILSLQDHVLFSSRSTNPIGEPGGRLWSMPFHGGQHRWAASMLEAHQQHHDAAEQYALEAHWCDVGDQDKNLAKAASSWEVAQEPEWGARLWQGVGDRPRAAAGYEKASLIWRIRDPGRAAFYCLLEADIFEQDNQPEEAEKARRRAESLSPLPYLCLDLATNPTLVQHENGEITLRIKNTGRAPARNIDVYVGGTLLHSVHFSADPQQEIPANRWWHLTMNITPTQEENQLDVCVECVDRKERGEPFRHFFTGKIHAKPAPVIIKAGDMVKGKIKLKGFKGEPIRVEVGDMVMSEIEIVNES